MHCSLSQSCTAQSKLKGLTIHMSGHCQRAIEASHLQLQAAYLEPYTLTHLC